MYNNKMDNSLLAYLQSVQQTPNQLNPESNGLSDDIPAMLSEGEFIVNAEQVSKLGGGATDPGHNALEEIFALIDQMDRDTAVLFADQIIITAELLLEEQPKIEKE